MKKLLVALGILVGLLVLAGAAIVLLVDVNAHKPRIETAVSDALGMEFRIRGKAGLRLFPSAGIALSDVRLRNRGTDLATAETLRVGVRLLPLLLDRQVNITELALGKPVIRIEKGADGKFNYETPPGPVKPASKGADASSAPLNVARSSISAGKIVYVDRKAGSETSLDAIDLSVRDLSIPTARGAELMKGVTFTGDLSVKEIRSRDLAVSDVRAKVTAGGGIYEIRPIAMKLFGGAGEGGIRIDLSGDRMAMSGGIAFSDLRLRKRDTDLATVEKVRVGVRLLPLPDRQVEITELVIEKPVIRIEKDADGKFNYETPADEAKLEAKPKEADAPSAPLKVARSSVSAGKVVYVDRKTGGETSFDAIDLSVRDLSIPTARGAELMKGISFTGDLSMKGIRSKDLAVSDVRAKVTAGAGIYEIRPFTMKLFGGEGTGGVRVDLSGDRTALKVGYTLANFRAEEPLAALARKKYLSGTMTVTPDLSLRGKGADEMKRTLSGTVSLRGDGLTLHGMEIDRVLSTVEAAQNLNLADVGAFLLAGPLGSAVVKGYRYGEVYRSTAGEGESRITRLVSDWTVRNGVAEARDVAFSTEKNRIALKGKLDLVNGQFVDVTVAALDGKGCAKLRQKISGPFADPRMDRMSMLQSVAAPILGILEREARRFLGSQACEPFYTGTVPHPK